jgi:AcrR family transcriptional regulator
MTNDKGRKVHEKKLSKEKDIADAAYHLFIDKGFQETAIDEIVKNAGVAKGTFYLYFKDKYDIIDRIILNKSSGILREALEYTLEKELDDFTDKIICFIDYIIEYLKINKKLLRLIYKNLSWGLYNKALTNPNQSKEMNEISNLLLRDMEMKGKDTSEIAETVFMIVELTGSVCYSAIVLEEPGNMDRMKPILFKMIKKMLS